MCLEENSRVAKSTEPDLDLFLNAVSKRYKIFDLMLRTKVKMYLYECTKITLTSFSMRWVKDTKYHN